MHGFRLRANDDPVEHPQQGVHLPRSLANSYM